MFHVNKDTKNDNKTMNYFGLKITQGTNGLN